MPSFDFARVVQLRPFDEGGDKFHGPAVVMQAMMVGLAASAVAGIAFLTLLAMGERGATIVCGIAACGFYALATGLMFRYGMPGAGKNSVVHLVLMLAVMAAAT